MNVNMFAKKAVREAIVAVLVGGLAANLCLSGNGGRLVQASASTPPNYIEERTPVWTSDSTPEAAETAAWEALSHYQVDLYQRLFTTPFERAAEAPLMVAGPVAGLGIEHKVSGVRPLTGEMVYFTPVWIGIERPFPPQRVEGIGEITGGRAQETIGWLESSRTFQPESALVIIVTVDMIDGSQQSLLLPMLSASQETIDAMLLAHGIDGPSNVSVISDCYGGRFNSDPIYLACSQGAQMQYLNDLNNARANRDGCLRDAIGIGLGAVALCLFFVPAGVWASPWGAIAAIGVCAVISAASGLATWSSCTSSYTRAVGLAYQPGLFTSFMSVAAILARFAA